MSSLASPRGRACSGIRDAPESRRIATCAERRLERGPGYPGLGMEQVHERLCDVAPEGLRRHGLRTVEPATVRAIPAVDHEGLVTDHPQSPGLALIRLDPALGLVEDRRGDLDDRP